MSDNPTADLAILSLKEAVDEIHRLRAEVEKLAKGNLYLLEQLEWERGENRRLSLYVSKDHFVENERLTHELAELKLATLAALTAAGICMLEENPITPSEVKGAIKRLARERDNAVKEVEKIEAISGDIFSREQVEVLRKANWSRDTEQRDLDDLADSHEILRKIAVDQTEIARKLFAERCEGQDAKKERRHG